MKPYLCHMFNRKKCYNMKTRKTIQLIMLFVCLFTMGNTHATTSNDEKKKVFIPLGIGKPVIGDDMRGLTTIPFTAYYQEGTIYTCTSGEFSSIDISVTNEATGQMWSTIMDISDGMGEISVSDGGAGSYTIEILTEYGECFVGRFTL